MSPAHTGQHEVGLYWFRNDLRMADNPALLAAAARARLLLPVYCHPADPDERTTWGCARVGMHRRRFVQDTLQALDQDLRARGSQLVEVHGAPGLALPALARRVGATAIWCEDIAAPQEQAELATLHAAGLAVHSFWQSTLLDVADLPFDVTEVPEVFTAFRQRVEQAGVRPRAPLPAPTRLPPCPAAPIGVRPAAQGAGQEGGKARDAQALGRDPRASFPYGLPGWHGGEAQALAHVQAYLASGRVHRYKETRNQLMGPGFSSKWSPWLATGALSPRVAYEALAACEARDGASDGSYWLWFELLWRDHFRLMHLRHGQTLYGAQGLAGIGGRAALPPPPRHHPQRFAQWCEGRTGHSLVDAAMRELATTGYLSNRLRQVVASYLLHDLGGDWRAGAAWFESQLIDFDVYSNQGNWLYISGRGTDPRGGRRFNPDKQAQDHDPHGLYRAMWSAA